MGQKVTVVAFWPMLFLRFGDSLAFIMQMVPMIEENHW